jgi:hypothetical protein
VRLAGDGLLEELEGFIDLAGFAKGDGEIDLEFGAVGLEAEGGAIGFDGLGELIAIAPASGQIEECFGVVGTELEGQGEGVGCFFGGMGGEIGVAKIDVVFGGSGIEGDGGLNQFDGGGGTGGLAGDDAEEMKGVGGLGVGGEDLAVDGFGLGELSGLVELDGRGELLIEGRGGR